LKPTLGIRDPNPRSWKIFAFHKTETLQELVSQETTLRSRLKNITPLITEELRKCQIKAIENLEESFAEAKPRSLIQTASGCLTSAHLVVIFITMQINANGCVWGADHTLKSATHTL